MSAAGRFDRHLQAAGIAAASTNDSLDARMQRAADRVAAAATELESLLTQAQAAPAPPAHASVTRVIEAVAACRAMDDAASVTMGGGAPTINTSASPRTAGYPTVAGSTSPPSSCGSPFRLSRASSAAPPPAPPVSVAIPGPAEVAVLKASSCVAGATAAGAATPSVPATARAASSQKDAVNGSAAKGGESSVASHSLHSERVMYSRGMQQWRQLVKLPGTPQQRNAASALGGTDPATAAAAGGITLSAAAVAHEQQLKKFHHARFNHFRSQPAPSHEAFDDQSVHRPRRTAVPKAPNLSIFSSPRVGGGKRRPLQSQQALQQRSDNNEGGIERRADNAWVHGRMLGTDTHFSEVCKEMYSQLDC